MTAVKKLRVLLVVHPDLIPPSRPKAQDLEKALWRSEYDVARVLKKMGHDTRFAGVYDDVKPLREAVEEFRPHVAFNLMEEFGGDPRNDHYIPAYLEMLGVPYTGCNPRGLMLCRNKGLAKMILEFHGIPTPPFEVIRRNEAIRLPEHLKFPLFVKSLTEESSFGVSQTSIVKSEKSFLDRVRFIHTQTDSDALIEQFIDGKELYVGVLGNRKPVALPVWELKFMKAPEGLPRIATARVKFNPEYRRKYGITTGPAKGIKGPQQLEIQKLSRKAFEVLELSGFARMDVRMDDQGKVYFLEANPNPHIGKEEDFAQSALKADLSYAELLQKVLNLGIKQAATPS